MASQQSKAQKGTVERVMHEFKHGELENGHGQKVRKRRQAVAIALEEAGASNQESPKKNREHLARTKAKERRGETARDEAEGHATRSELYEQAKKRDIAGRSKMSKSELEHALQG